MRTALKLLLATALLALSASPAFAMPPEGTPSHGHGNGQGTSNGPEYGPAEPPTPGPKAGMPEKAKAYGRYCKGESKKHVKGEKGTAFSRCVTNMAKVATNEDMTPKQACKAESKKHVKGEKGTAFSRCVKAAAKLRHQQEQEESTEGGEEGKS